MIEKKDLFALRADITRRIGSKVKLETNKRHNKSIVSEGIIANAYPSIFTIELSEGPQPLRTVSYSYTDILTNAVAITLCE